MVSFRKFWCCALPFLLISCGFLSPVHEEEIASAEFWSDPKKIKVYATTPMVADNVRRIGGDRVEVISLMGKEIDPHSYEMVKGDDEKLRSADIVFANGLSLEHTATMRQALKLLPRVVYLSSAIPQSAVIVVHGSPDPHIWMDLTLWSETTKLIEAALIEIDPEHAEEYKERGEKTRQCYAKADQEIWEIIQTIPKEKRRLVTSHDAFNYFARRYLEQEGEWKERVIAIQGLAPDEQISSFEIRRVVEYVKQHDVQVIFGEQNLSHDSLEKVVDSCRRSAKNVILAKEELYGDTLGTYDYLDMMYVNTHIIASNLKNCTGECADD